MKVCSKCKVEKPATVEYFPASPPHAGGLHSWCRDCNREYHRDWDRANRPKREYEPEKGQRYSKTWRERNPEKVREYSAFYVASHKEEIRAYYKAHKDEYVVRTRNRKARKLANGGVHTIDDVRSQYERQKGKCFYCHTKLGEYHVDHVVPLVLGGSNGPENLVVSCPHCNLSKQAKHPMDFAGVML